MGAIALNSKLYISPVLSLATAWYLVLFQRSMAMGISPLLAMLLSVPLAAVLFFNAYVIKTFKAIWVRSLLISILALAILGSLVLHAAQVRRAPYDSFPQQPNELRSAYNQIGQEHYFLKKQHLC